MILATVLMPQQTHAASIYHNTTHAQLSLLQQQQQQQTHKKRSVDMGLEMPWVNPCGGIYLDNMPMPISKPQRIKILRDLGKAIGRSYRTNSMERVINIKNMSDWSTYDEIYKFLPILKTNNTNIPLRIWHPKIQVYVAAFYYLYLARSRWDQERGLAETPIAIELKHFLVSSQKLLCEIESAANRTMPFGPKRLRTISRAVMQRRLKFATDLSPIFAGNAERQVSHVNGLDIKIVKYRFIGIEREMAKKLREMVKKLRAYSKPNAGKRLSTEKPAGTANNKTKLTKQPKQQTKRRKSKRFE